MSRTRPGDSFETAIEILAASPEEGVPQEYRHLSCRFGRKGVDWEILRQDLIEHDGRRFDKIGIRAAHRTMDIFFDISSFISPRSVQRCQVAVVRASRK